MDNQYRIIAALAGWAPGGREWLRFDGADALPFLQALVSNDVARLEPGQGIHATYLSPQGRMIADLDILRLPDHVVVGVPAGLGDVLAARFDSLIFAEDLRISRSPEMASDLMVVGADAARVVAETVGAEPKALEALAELAHHPCAGAFVVRTGDSALPSFHVVTTTDRARLIEGEFDKASVVRLSSEMSTALRVEAARPLWGVDMTTETIPLEAGLLERAISTSKGCYVGQEVVIRILHRGGGRVVRRLVRLAWPSGVRDVPATGAVVRVGESEVGAVTSAAYVPSERRVMALAYVHRDHANLGATVIVDGHSAEISGFAR